MLVVAGLVAVAGCGFVAWEWLVWRELFAAHRALAAGRYFADAGNGTPDLMVDEALARVYLELYDFSHGSAVLIRWAKDAPDDPRPPWWRAELNRRRAAEPDVIIADYRAKINRRRGELADALAHLDRAVQLAPFEVRAEYYDRVGDWGTARNYRDQGSRRPP